MLCLAIAVWKNQPQYGPPQPSLLVLLLVRLLLLQSLILISLAHWGVNTGSDHHHIIFAPCCRFLSVSDLTGSITDQLKSLKFPFLCEQADPLFSI